MIFIKNFYKNMNNSKPTLTSLIDAHPRDVFQALVDRKAEIDWAREPRENILPKSELREYMEKTGQDYLQRKKKQEVAHPTLPTLSKLLALFI